ncbi:MAG: ATP-binding domain-containing protein, partial [Pirellulaceae bacterium]|nr:ATP-binding domain-containing protein [Pirellulaceae bacterium]
FTAIGETCRQLIVHQQVQPEDICILYNGKNLQKWLIDKTQPVLADLGIELSIQTNRPFKRHSHMLLATTAHSFKGYDSEIVIVAGVDQFRAEGTGILANSLYVAMTRARSILKLFSRHVPEPEVERLSSVMEQCLDYLTTAPTIDRQTSLQDDLLAVLDQIGLEHRAWLEDLWQRFEISQEPIVTDAGEIIAQPLFSFSWLMGHYACFGNQPLFRHVLDKLEEHQITVLAPGAPLFS